MKLATSLALVLLLAQCSLFAQCENQYSEDKLSLKVCLEEGWTVKVPGEQLVLDLPDKSTLTITQEDVLSPPNVKSSWKEKFGEEIDPSKTVLFRESYPTAGSIIRTVLYKDVDLFVSTVVITHNRRVVYGKLLARNSAELAHKNMESFVKGLTFVPRQTETFSDNVNTFKNDMESFIRNYDASSPLLITKELIMKDAGEAANDPNAPDMQFFIDRWHKGLQQYTRQLSQYESFEVTYFNMKKEKQQEDLPITYFGELFVTPKDFVEPIKARFSAMEVDGKIYLMNIVIPQ